MERTKKLFLLALACLVVILTSGYADGDGDNWFGKWKKGGSSNKAKNIIIMIPDGCDETVQTLARWYKGYNAETGEMDMNARLQVDSMQGGGIMQHMANSVITGSAAAATAFACGHKTTVRFLGVGPRIERKVIDDNGTPDDPSDDQVYFEYDLLTGYEPTCKPYAPIASILEAAQLAGKATGIAVTCRVTHATPAAFACHIEDRGWDNDIIEHMVYNNIDVVFGGGARHLIPADEAYITSFGAEWGGKRTDGENLLDVLLDRGYQFVDSKEGLKKLKKGKVWGLFDDSHMQPDIDRKHFAPHEPSLAEMVEKAIELLSKDRDGFLLMVEGPQVDWAGHNNDPVYMLTDFIAFDDAVKVACDFAKKDGETVVMAYPDHNTGGMKIGHYYTPMGYTETTVEDLVVPFKKMDTTANGIVSFITDDDGNLLPLKKIKSIIKQHWGIEITQEDIAEIRELEPSVGMSYALARVISKNHTVVGWTTHGHNGETVPLWMYGMDAPAGIIDNTELAEIAAEAIGVDLKKTTETLYIDLSEVTDKFEIVDDGLGNITAEIGNVTIPASKDYLIVSTWRRDIVVPLPGITVYASGDDNVEEKVYVCKKAIQVLDKLHLLH